MRPYFSLVKPGIIFGNLLTALGGFFLASHGSPAYETLAWMLGGLAAVIGSAAIVNNYIDQDIDALMERTKHRAFVRGTVSVHVALILSGLLGVGGIIALAFGTNYTTAFVASMGFCAYIFLYTLWAKRRFSYGMHVGTLSGAVPVVAGYTAAAGRPDLGALIVFLIVGLWQLPHFLAIALYRADDYAAAGVPVLPLRRGSHTTKLHILLSVVALGITAPTLTAYGYAGYGYAAGAALLSAGWIGLAVSGYYTTDTRRWARRMFVYSLVVMSGLSLLMALDSASL